MPFGSSSNKVNPFLFGRMPGFLQLVKRRKAAAWGDTFLHVCNSPGRACFARKVVFAGKGARFGEFVVIFCLSCCNSLITILLPLCCCEKGSLRTAAGNGENAKWALSHSHLGSLSLRKRLFGILVWPLWQDGEGRSATPKADFEHEKGRNAPPKGLFGQFGELLGDIQSAHEALF